MHRPVFSYCAGLLSRRLNGDHFCLARQTSMMSRQDEILIFGDSMIQHVENIQNACVRSYRGDNLEDLGNHLKYDRIPLIYGKKVIWVHAGTNDILFLLVEEMLEDLYILLQNIRMRNNEAKLFVSAILPRPLDFKATQDKVIAFNKAVIDKQVAWNFTFIHSYNIFQHDRLPKRDMYYLDNTHPSVTGAIKLSTTWGKRLKQVKDELGIEHDESGNYTLTVSTKKRDGYGYPDERERRQIIFPKSSDGPVYASDFCQRHFPRDPVLRGRGRGAALLIALAASKNKGKGAPQPTTSTRGRGRGILRPVNRTDLPTNTLGTSDSSSEDDSLLVREPPKLKSVVVAPPCSTVRTSPYVRGRSRGNRYQH